MNTSSRRKHLVGTAALTAAALLLAACGGSSTASEAGGGSPTYGGTLTFFDPVQYTARTPTNSIWSNSQITGNLAERLVWQGPPTGDFKPWLAASWEVSADHLTYTFHLRKDVTFSNGDPLDAETVKLNFDQHGLGDKVVAMPPDSFWVNYRGTEVVDAHTVKVKLTRPNAGFLQVLSNYRASSILGKPFLKQDLNGQGKLENWVGTGPFVVEKVDGTIGVTLKRRDDYRRLQLGTRRLWARGQGVPRQDRLQDRPRGEHPGRRAAVRRGADRPQHRAVRRGDRERTHLDRHWRNARTLASHNPVVYKPRVIGDLLVNGTPPNTSYDAKGTS